MYNKKVLDRVVLFVWITLILVSGVEQTIVSIFSGVGYLLISYLFFFYFFSVYFNSFFSYSFVDKTFGHGFEIFSQKLVKSLSGIVFAYF